MNRRTIRWVLAAVAMFIPMGVVAVSPLPVDVFLIYLGLLPTLVALREGSAVALTTAFLTPAATAIGVLLSGTAWLGTLYMTALALGVTWAWSRGWPGAGSYIVSQAALATISPPAGLVEPGSGVPVPAPLALGAILVGGLWVVLIGRLMLRDLPTGKHAAPDREALVRYAATLTPLVAVATFVTMTWGPGLHAWWVVLSLLVIVQPDRQVTTRRAVERILGTIAGSAGAALVLVAAGRSPLVTVLGVLFAVGSAVCYLKASYWIFTTLLTSALVLLTFAPGRVVQGEAERIGFTLVAALAVLAVGIGVGWADTIRARSTGPG